jgi:GAF domain-containing protein
MKRRSKVSGKPAKTRRPKASTLKRRSQPTEWLGPGSSTDQRDEISRLERELNDARERETATSEVLKVISGFQGNLEPVFAVMLENAVRICDAKFGNIYRWDGETAHLVATYNTPPAFAEHRKRLPHHRPDPERGIGRMFATKQIIHVADAKTEPSYVERRNSSFVAAVELGGVRSYIAAPMVKDGVLIGGVTLCRQEVRPFADKQIALVQNFAAQAVIAIENTRLLGELRQRTDDLSEALEQQTATSEVLQVISGSPGDLEPVFTAMLQKAVRICDATFGNIYRWDGEVLRLVAAHNTPSAFADYRARAPVTPGTAFTTSVPGRMVATKAVVHVPDLSVDPAYINRNPQTVAAVELGGTRTLIAAPMLKDDKLIGGISLVRQEVRPFSDKQISLLTNFAAQAVIAIENARLLNELRQSLEQQTATGEILSSMSGSIADTQPVFDAIVRNLLRLFGTRYATIQLLQDGLIHLPAIAGEQGFEQMVKQFPRPLSEESFSGRAMILKETIRYAPILDNPTVSTFGQENAREFGYNSIIFTPMIRGDKVVGAIGTAHREAKPFNEQQVALLKAFADQAVIAIENTRLLNELRERTTDLSESLEQQTATAEVLHVISSSPGEVEQVFAAMLEKAVRICDAVFGNIFSWDGNALQHVAGHNTPPAFAEARKRLPLGPTPGSAFGRVITTKAAVHIIDLAAEQEYIERSIPGLVAAVELGGIRTLLVVPLLKENEPIGAFSLSRQEVRPFTGKQIELLQNFAAQAVIAIENARLLNELRERTEEVGKLNQHLEQRVADQVGEIERMGRLRRFLPPQVADLIVASGTEKQLESHRREITALFCDLRGFTGFSESADPEDVMTVLREYHEALGASITKYSGTLERYAGDGVMVVFNDPVPIENPALQAVLMALEMRDAIGALTETWRRWGHDIGFGIGISHGFATLGTIGFEGRFDYAAIGTVSNVASRLCDEAKPGQILISPRVLTKVESAVKVEPVGEFELKGIRRPLAAYNVVCAVSTAP